MTYWFLPLGSQDRAPWFHTHHPRYGGYWSQNEDHWPVFKDVLRREYSGSAPDPKSAIEDGVRQ